MTKTKEQKYGWDKGLLIPGIILTIGSPGFAHLFSPIGCTLFPQKVDRNAWQLWSPCDATEFAAFWIILFLFVVTGIALIAQSVKAVSKK